MKGWGCAVAAGWVIVAMLLVLLAVSAWAGWASSPDQPYNQCHPGNVQNPC